MKQANIDLQVHPFLGNNTLVDVVEAMALTNLDVVALEAFNESLYPKVLEEAQQSFEGIVHDQAGIKLPNGRYLLNSREYNTFEGIHVLTIGYSMDKATQRTEIRELIDNALSNNALVILDHPFVDNIHTRTAGHISKLMEGELESLAREYSGQIAAEWNGYCIPWMRRGLQFGLNCVGISTLYHDVNKAVEYFSERLASKGINIPVLADTDLHARRKSHLLAMGTGRIIMDIEGQLPAEIVDSMKRNVFAGNYKNQKEYVGASHLLGAFCLPILFPRYFHKPRA
jgi:hypothetical protein